MKHADETGMRIEEKLQGLHTLSDSETRHYRVAGCGDMPVGVTGTLVSSVYMKTRKTYHALLVKP
jgi:hypothetical protein